MSEAAPEVMDEVSPDDRELLARLKALTDGVFAIALTLMILEIRVPDHQAIHTGGQLLEGLIALAPRFLAYLVSFLSLVIFWFGQQSQHRLLRGMDRRLATLHLCFLATVSLLPFSTDFLSEFVAFRLSIVIYWLNSFLLGTVLFASWRYAHRHHLVRRDADMAAVYNRIGRAQILWGIGALLGLISVPLGLIFILAVQITYAVDPQARAIRRIIG